MKKTSLVALMLFAFFSLFAQTSARRVLFLGNSYTYVNNLPAIIANIANSMGDTLIYDSYLPGGYTLDQHYADTISTNKIKSGGWDFVVLQDQSQVPALEGYSGAGAVYLCMLIKQFNPCARPMFYMTWGRKNGDADNCAAWPPVCTYEGMDSMLYDSYMHLAMNNHGDVSPVGQVWKHLRNNHPLIDLYHPDNSHPSAAGSFAAACSFYAAIFKKDPTPSVYNYVLSIADAAIIKNAARQIVYDSLSKWQFPEPLPQARFVYETGINDSVHFFNRSANAESYTWDFGDGHVSTERDPAHHYGANGNYQVSLTASNCDLDQLYHSAWQVNIGFCTFTPTVIPGSLFVCPGRDDSLSTQLYDSYQWFIDGDSITGETAQAIKPHAVGRYSVLVSRDGCTEMSRPGDVTIFNLMQTYHIEKTGEMIGEDSVCQGNNLMLLLTPNRPPYPRDEDVVWLKDGIPLPNSNDDTLIISSAGVYAGAITSPYCNNEVVYTTEHLHISFVNCNLISNTQSGISAFPNPSSDFYVRIPVSMVGCQYMISDITGRELESGIFSFELNRISLRSKSKGVYILRVHGKQVATLRLLKA
jgi:hypothetical protein